MPRSKRRFGRIRRLPSGRWQARYHGPDGIDRAAPDTFARRADADRWLSTVEDQVVHGDWLDPDAGLVPLAACGARWIAERAGLRPRTRQLYGGLFRLHIDPVLGSLALSGITPDRVRTWRTRRLDAGVGEVTVAKAYRLLKTILGTAVDDQLLRSDPCRIRGAATERSAERVPLTTGQVFALAEAVPERFRLLVLLGTFCSLRFGELAALTRADLDPVRGLVHVRHTLVEAGGQPRIGPPKSAAGRRLVAIPAALLPEVASHLDRFVADRPDAVVFTGEKGALLGRGNFHHVWKRAREKAGVPEVHFHDLRHTGNTLTAQAGATLSDLMSRMGHSSTRAARIYLHTTSERDRAVAAALNGHVAWPVGHVAGTAADPEGEEVRRKGP